MSLPIIQSFVALSAAWLLWRIVRNLVMKSPLDNIPGPEPTSWLKGNLPQLYDRHGWNFQDELGEKYESVVKIHSIFGRKALFVFDPRALHTIIIKDQYVFEPSDWATTSMAIIMGPGLLATYGEHHRKQRKMLNPVFSIKHMRHMTPIFYRVSHNLCEGIKNEIGSSSKDIDILHWIHRTALELVGQGGLGYSFDSLKEDVPYTAYAKAMKELSATMFNMAFYRMLIPYFVKLGPKWFRRWLAENAPFERVKHVTQIVNIMDENTRRIFYQKKAALEAGDAAVVEQVGNGKDIMSILLKANIDASEEDRLSEEELLGQMSTLVFAATDTTTSALAQIFHLLAEHSDVQEKLRAEVANARMKAGGDIPHDELMALPYLDAVCRETLRLYSPVTFISRDARRDAVLPLSQPIRGVNGQMMQEIHVPKDTPIVVGIRASNVSKGVWGEDAKEWKPERWLKPLPDTVADAHIPGVYSNLMTFNGGGRACIGFKFSQLEMKVVLSVLLESFKFSMPDCAKEVIWNMAGIRYPTIGGTSNHAEFPMKVMAIN